MRILVKATELDLTPSLKTYIEEKLGALERFIRRFDLEGAASLRVEVGRTTYHHKHGKVFRAEANLELPGGILRAENQHEDLRVAIDKVKALLKTEIEKYRARHIPQRSQRRSKT